MSACGGGECAPRPHRGGDELHNWCADVVPPNVVWDGRIGGLRGVYGQGCDVVLGPRHFDAMAWDSRQTNRELWEVTTRDWSNYYKYDDALKECILRRYVDLFAEDCLLVLACNVGIVSDDDKLSYALGIAHEGLYHAVHDYFAVPENLDALRLRRPPGVTDEPMDYCRLVNPQQCRR